MSGYASREFRDLGHLLIEEAKQSLGSDGASAPRSSSVSGFRGRSTVHSAVSVAAGASGVVKEIGKICGKAGAAGAAVDGAVGGLKAVPYVRAGDIDRAQAAKHVGAEAGCGFVTSSTGTAGTLAVFMLTGKMGPAALVAGMSASMGSRYLYREVVGETLPDAEPGNVGDADADLEDIGRGSGAESEGIEDIGPGTPPPPESGDDSGRDVGGKGESGGSGSDEESPEAGEDPDPFEDIGPAE